MMNVIRQNSMTIGRICILAEHVKAEFETGSQHLFGIVKSADGDDRQEIILNRATAEFLRNELNKYLRSTR
jgi:hypothetical protein